MQSSNLVTIHRIAGFQRAEYSQIMTQKTVPHVLIPCSYTTLCVHLQTTPIDSKDMKKTVRIPTMEIQYRCLQESWILFCNCHQQNHQVRFGSESLWIWPRRRKNPPSRADPRQAIAGVAKGRVESRKHSWSKHISFSRWEKINTKIHKWYCSSLRSEILFAKFQPGVIFFTADFHKPQTEKIL